MLDRVSDVSRVFPTAIDVGCGRGHFAKQLGDDASDLIGSLYQCDIAENAVVSCKLEKAKIIQVSSPASSLNV